MKMPPKWSRRILAVLLNLFSIGWITAKSSQWLFRMRAERLFADFRSLQINGSSSDAQSLLRKWGQHGSTISNCDGDLCRTSFSMFLTLPPLLCGRPYGVVHNILPAMADFLGFRNEGAGFDFTTQGGIITQKGFGMDVALPVVGWIRWDKSYIPDLAVWSNETAKFNDHEESHRTASYPFRVVRQIRGVYGMGVAFTPEESPSEQAALTNFHFTCLTQFFPCQSLGDILPEGWQMLQQQPAY
jgi:hypothetical protein